jgi:hypothetical protein
MMRKLQFWFSAITTIGKHFLFRLNQRDSSQRNDMPSQLPACIRPNAQPFTRLEFAALMLDEIEKMAQEGCALDRVGVPKEAGAYLI